MNFGFNLPGPFRINVSDKGRVSGSVNVGPFSVSGNLAAGGGQRAVRFPGTLDQVLAQAHAEGFTIDWVTPGSGATMHKGWLTLRLTVVRGGVRAERVTSARTILAWTVGVLAILGFCWSVMVFS